MSDIDARFSSHPQARAAADPTTPPQRLAELAQDETLHPLLAANPATPPETLQRLHRDSAEIQRLLAQNPNTPLPVLKKLAITFPIEFLNNPVLLLLQLTNPNFIHDFSLDTWKSLLRYEQVPTYWLHYFLQRFATPAYSYRYRADETIPARMHVSIAGEVQDDWQFQIAKAIRAYRQQYRQADVQRQPLPDALFFCHTLLYQEHIANIKKHWMSTFSYNCPAKQQRLLLAYTPRLPAIILAAFSSSSDVTLRCLAARHPNTPPQVLTYFASSTQPALRQAVATHPRLPVEAAIKLAGDTSYMVRKRVANHPGFRGHEDVQAILALDDEPEVRCSLTTRPDLSAELVTTLQQDTDPQVRATLACNSHIAPERLAMLAEDTEISVQAAAACNARLPLEQMPRLYKHADTQVRVSLARNARLPIDLIEALALDPIESIRQQIASHRRLPAGIVEKLVQSDDPEILSRLARNTATPGHILSHLATRPHATIQQGLAANPHTPVEILYDIMLRHPKGQQLELGKALARNHNTPLDLIEQLLNSQDLILWCLFITHPTVQRTQYQPLKDLFVRLLRTHKKQCPSWFYGILLENPSIPAEILHDPASSLIWEERYRAAMHRQTPLSVLEQLTHDGNRYVRAMARLRLSKRRQ